MYDDMTYSASGWSFSLVFASIVIAVGTCSCGVTVGITWLSFLSALVDDISSFNRDLGADDNGEIRVDLRSSTLHVLLIFMEALESGITTLLGVSSSSCTYSVGSKDADRAWISKSSFKIDSSSTQSSDDSPDLYSARERLLGMGHLLVLLILWVLLSSGKMGAGRFNERLVDIMTTMVYVYLAKILWNFMMNLFIFLLVCVGGAKMCRWFNHWFYPSTWQRTGRRNLLK